MLTPQACGALFTGSSPPELKPRTPTHAESARKGPTRLCGGSARANGKSRPSLLASLPLECATHPRGRGLRSGEGPASRLRTPASAKTWLERRLLRSSLLPGLLPGDLPRMCWGIRRCLDSKQSLSYSNGGEAHPRPRGVSPRFGTWNGTRTCRLSRRPAWPASGSRPTSAGERKERPRASRSSASAREQTRLGARAR